MMQPFRSIGRRSLARLALLWRARSAVAAVEFAMMAPILVILFIGIVDCAQAFIVEMKLSSAVAAGAQYVVNNSSSVGVAGDATIAANTAAIVGNTIATGWASGTIVLNNGSTSTFANGTASASGSTSTSCYCPSGTSPSTWAWGSAATCGSACTTSLAGKFVTITASRTLSPFFSHYFVLPHSITQYIVVETQ